jgi:hypothetical protein
MIRGDLWYDPLNRLERINPILRRELHVMRHKLSSKGLYIYDGASLRFAFVLLACSVFGFVSLRYPLPVLVPWLALIGPSLLVSIVADAYNSVRTIMAWRVDSRHEAWDTLRLAMRDDDEVIHTYEAIGNVLSWSHFRMDMAMRAIPVVLTVVACAGIGIWAVVGLLSQQSLRNTGIRVGDLWVLLAIGFFGLRVASLYISEPIWRFRSNTLWSLLCAIKFRETTTAIIVAIAGGLGIRLLHLGAFVVVWLVWQAWLSGYVIQPATLVAIFLVVLGVIVPQIRWLYMRLYAWLERQTIMALRRGDV